MNCPCESGNKENMHALSSWCPCSSLCRSELLYYVAIVALKDIPAYTELTYDYGYSNKSKDAGGQVRYYSVVPLHQAVC